MEKKLASAQTGQETERLPAPQSVISCQSHFFMNFNILKCLKWPQLSLIRIQGFNSQLVFLSLLHVAARGRPWHVGLLRFSQQDAPRNQFHGFNGFRSKECLRQNWEAISSFLCKKLSFYSMILKYTKTDICQPSSNERQKEDHGRQEGISKTRQGRQLWTCSPKRSCGDHTTLSLFPLCLLPWNCCPKGPTWDTLKQASPVCSV